MFECHAAGPRRRLDLELSAGSNPLTPTADYGRKLAWRLGVSLGRQLKRRLWPEVVAHSHQNSNRHEVEVTG
ncbi:MAG: hypothetical protein DPW09_38890 [Anaerolineae bacterium]|nr:hypothetical protein [Anaerolineales bacterium]MCQ3979426.1 hypothetical protein [Anaerolineae bacterium]